MRRLVLPLVLAAALVVPAAASAAPVTVGIADNKPAMFLDPRFASLGIEHARTTVPWDVLKDPYRLRILDAYMQGARARGVSVLLTFDRSPRRTSYNPKPAEMAAALKGLRARYPFQVRDVAAWNEPNINKKPELVVPWWLALRQACPTCRVLPGELVDRGNAVSWAQRFTRLARREPRWWGLHNYLDANRASVKATKAFVLAVKGEVWLTETGGVVRRANTSVPFSGSGPAHAARAVAFVLQKLVVLDRRITRAYLYNWDTPTTGLSWDSGFIGPDGAERPALAVLRRLAPGGRARGTTKALPVPKPAKGAKPPAKDAEPPAKPGSAGKPVRP